jgi:PAS domain S-box-containing protein
MRKSKLSRLSIKLIFLYCVITIIVVAISVLYFSHQKMEERAEAYSELSVIADLKLEQIKNWRSERLGDASVFSESDLFIPEIKKILNNSFGKIVNEKFSSYINIFIKSYNYKDVIIVDSALKIKYVKNEKMKKLGTVTVSNFKEAILSKKPRFSNIYFCDNCNDIHLDVYIPLFDNNKLLGGLILRIDPNKFLFPLIQTWPTTSKSSETLLITREGDEVIFLNELRHKKNTAFNLRYKIDSSNFNVPAVMAAMGKTGMFEGLDYRGIPVLSDIRSIPESQWYMIAKVDLDEIYEPVKDKAINIFLIIGLLLISLMIGFIWIWTNQNNFLRIQYLEEENRRQAIVKHFEYLVKYANDIIILSDKDLNIIDVNQSALDVYGYTKEEMLKTNYKNLLTPEYYLFPENSYSPAELEKGVVFEAFHRKKDNSIFPVEVSVHIIEIGGKKYTQRVARDITERRNAEKTLKENEIKFRNLFENAILGIYRTTFDGQIIDCNPALMKMLGYNSFEELAKKNIELNGYAPGYSRSDFMKKIETKGEIRGYESSWLKKDGTPIFIRENAKAIRDKEGNFLFYEGTIEDITDRKKIEEDIKESENKFRTLIESMNEGVTLNELVLNEKSIPIDYKIIDVNSSFEKFTGISSEKARNQFASELYKIVPPQYFDEFSKVALTGIPNIFESYYQVIDKYFEISVFSPKKNFFATVISDITEHKQAEKEIKKLNEELEHRVIERTSQLVQSNKELEAFSYSVSHDLRSPLRSIDGFSLALFEDYFESLDEKAKDYIERIRNATKRMDELIDSLLRLSRVTRFDMKYDKVDLSKTINEIAEELKNSDNKRTSNFLIAKNVVAEGDKYLLKILLENLIGNSWKFTSKKEKTIIEFGSIAQDFNTIYFVKDNGVGFDMKYYDKLFGAFQRLHSKKDFSGTGIGLATVQRIVHRHNGKIWAESKLDIGTTFYFTLK